MCCLTLLLEKSTTYKVLSLIFTKSIILVKILLKITITNIIVVFRSSLMGEKNRN